MINAASINMGVKGLFSKMGDYATSAAGRRLGIAALRGAGTGALLGAGTAAVTGDNIMQGAFLGALGGGVMGGALRSNSSRIMSQITRPEGASARMVNQSFKNWSGRAVAGAGIMGGIMAGSRVGPSDDPSWKGFRGAKSLSRGLNGQRGQRF